MIFQLSHYHILILLTTIIKKQLHRVQRVGLLKKKSHVLYLSRYSIYIYSLFLYLYKPWYKTGCKLWCKSWYKTHLYNQLRFSLTDNKLSIILAYKKFAYKTQPKNLQFSNHNFFNISNHLLQYALINNSINPSTTSINKRCCVFSCLSI